MLSNQKTNKTSFMQTTISFKKPKNETKSFTTFYVIASTNIDSKPLNKITIRDRNESI